MGFPGETYMATPSLSLYEKMLALPITTGDKHVLITRQVYVFAPSKGVLVLKDKEDFFKLNIGKVADWNSSEKLTNAVVFVSTNLWKLTEEQLAKVFKSTTLKQALAVLIEADVSSPKLGFGKAVVKIDKPVKPAKPTKPTKKSVEPKGLEEEIDEDEDSD
jgi:hypothetical protein